MKTRYTLLFAAALLLTSTSCTVSPVITNNTIIGYAVPVAADKDEVVKETTPAPVVPVVTAKEAIKDTGIPPKQSGAGVVVAVEKAQDAATLLANRPKPPEFVMSLKGKFLCAPFVPPESKPAPELTKEKIMGIDASDPKAMDKLLIAHIGNLVERILSNRLALERALAAHRKTCVKVE